MSKNNVKMPPRPKAKKGTLKRVIKLVFKYYKGMLGVVAVAIVISSVVGSIAGVFTSRVLGHLEDYLDGNTGADAAYSAITTLVIILASLYLLGLFCTFLFNRLMAIVTQGTLKSIRVEMFNHMQTLPIKYFDTHNHGDVMSYYTNDIDTLRQLISQSLPQLLVSGITLTVLVCVMLSLSVWLTLLVFVGVIAMLFVTKYVGGRSARYFVQHQRSFAKLEGYVEEMMNGQKVVKVFCHEPESREKFDKINEEFFEDAKNANKYSNILIPILANIGNILYVCMAFAGGLLVIYDVKGLFGQVASVAAVATMLNMTRQFTQNVSQISQQTNAIVMALAGADRIFTLMGEESEVDDGYVTLVNAKEDENGELVECEERTGVWAWKHPHSADGTITYTKLMGDVRFSEVDFSYDGEHDVLHNVTLYAEPGQKVAFVGATGAGKTTITNLINRFYDIADGKIRYDGININKIKKDDLRRSLGIVLQDTNLFTGSVMENIRYGRLDATDEECIEAAKLANAHDFITRLPNGYNTMLNANGANLSQGQRQLISIARAAVADPPVMILDEATSSIDTRTEALVQAGMDSLMKGRTVFVIAHRLSTVQNSDVIMVLDHGVIIERGSHEQLITQQGKYYQLYTGAFELE